jgi:hypothetical protein
MTVARPRVTADMGIAGKGVGDIDGIGTVWMERAPGLISHPDVRERES